MRISRFYLGVNSRMRENDLPLVGIPRYEIVSKLIAAIIILTQERRKMYVAGNSFRAHTREDLKVFTMQKDISSRD